MSTEGEIVGMVDVLKLTYATLDQINTMSTGDGEGPAWNKFWMSLEHETESAMSGEGNSRMNMTADESHASPDHGRPGIERLDSVAPNDSASHTGLESPDPHSKHTGFGGMESTPFPFKFKAPNGRMHRLQVSPSSGLEDLVTVVAEKLGSEASSIGGIPEFSDGRLGAAGGFALSYLDNEGDTVSITTDGDLLEAVALALKGRRDKVDLFVHHPDQAPLPSTIAPASLARPPTPPASTIRERFPDGINDSDEKMTSGSTMGASVRSRRDRQSTVASVGSASDEHVVGATSASASQKEFIAGVPNELLLPGAIVTLAVVIVGVFAVTRSSSR